MKSQWKYQGSLENKLKEISLSCKVRPIATFLVERTFRFSGEHRTVDHLMVMGLKEPINSWECVFWYSLQVLYLEHILKPEKVFSTGTKSDPGSWDLYSSKWDVYHSTAILSTEHSENTSYSHLKKPSSFSIVSVLWTDNAFGKKNV